MEKAKAQREAKSQEDAQAYIQQKAELKVEENREFKLEAGEKRFEIGIEGERYEVIRQRGGYVEHETRAERRRTFE